MHVILRMGLTTNVQHHQLRPYGYVNGVSKMDHNGLPGQMILKVYLSNSPDTVSDVPITPETTCRDIVEYCREVGEVQCHLAELWRGCERPIEEEEKIYDILTQWGNHRNEVKFFLRHEGAANVDEQGRRQKKKGTLKAGSSSEDLKGSTELNLNELRDMASRQQQQIETQQQMLVAKQQRLKFLKQQEVKHQQVAIENERLRRLRDKVEQQEMKLQKLRVMQGQADTAKVTNTNLSELENLRSLFKEKEHELANAVAKVDQLTHQLENIRRGNAGSLQSSAASHELERLRRELLHRNQMNDQQSRMLENQRQVLGQRKGDVILVDKRIEELTDLLRQKRAMQNQQRQSPVPGGPRSAPSNNTNNNATTRSLPNGNIGQIRPEGHQDYDRGSPQLDNGGHYPGQRPPLAPRPNRLFNGTNGNDGNRQRPPPSNKPVPAPKPSIVNHPGGFKPRTGSSVPITGPQGTPLVPSQTQVDVGHRKADGNVDASGSETSSLTENSSVDSVPSSTSYSQLRQSGNLASNSRPGAGSPNQQGSANRWPGQNRPNSPSQENKDLRVQVQRNLPLSQNDPRGNYLFNRPAGDRSPMYSPSGQPSSSSWDSPDLDPTPLPPSTQQRHPSSPSGKKGPPPPPRNENTKLTNYGVISPSPSAPNAPFQGGPNQSFYGKANSSHGPESTVPITTADGTDSTRPHHQRSPATVGMYAPPPNAHDRNYNRPSYEQGYHNPPYQRGRPLNFHTSDLFPINTMQGVPEEGSEDAPISPNRPASPVKFPTLALQRYMDPQRIHNMPRPLKKRLSYTESKDENFSFLNAELRNKLPFYQQEQPPQAKLENFHDPNQPQHFKQQPPGPGGPGTITLAPIAAAESSEKTSVITPPEDTRTEPKPPPESEKKPETSKYRNDAIMSHQQYSKALSQVSRSPIIEQTKKQNKGIKGILKNPKSKSKGIRVRFDPLALLLDASLEGEFSLVRQIIPEVSNPSGANDEGITALHNAICANHYEIVNFLIQYGVDVNSPDSDGWTPLHCAASCNNIIMVRNLVEHGACLYATTISDRETPAQKCEEEEEGFQGCSDYLFGMQNKMGVDPKVPVSAVYSYTAEKEDELNFRDGDEVSVLRKGDDKEQEWWWVRIKEKEGYIPRNLLASCPRVKPLYR